MEGGKLQLINVAELKPHQRNNEFFDDMSGEKWKEFLESIKSRGVIEPIVITPEKVIVSGHQRVRACKELGIKEVMCDMHSYNTEDEVLQDLLETNIRQRGDVGGSAKKVGLRIKELERIYGVKQGGAGFYGNRHTENLESPNYSETLKTQEQLAKEMGFSIDTLRNYKKLTEMIPELEELVDTGIATPTTALAIMRNLTEKEQLDLISNMDTTKKITKREVQKYIDEIKKLKENPVVIDETDYEAIGQLESKISKLESEKRILENKARLNQQDADKFNKLKSDIDFLTKQKSSLGRQIDSATELSGMTVRLQKLLEEELAPIKFKRCMEVLDSSDVCVQNLTEIIEKIIDWTHEMKQVMSEKLDDYEEIIDVK